MLRSIDTFPPPQFLRAIEEADCCLAKFQVQVFDGRTYIQQLSLSARFWKAPESEWLRALSNNFRPSGVLVWISCTEPTRLLQRLAKCSSNSFFRANTSGTAK